jgi:hypothetical protein
VTRAGFFIVIGLFYITASLAAEKPIEDFHTTLAQFEKWIAKASGVPISEVRNVGNRSPVGIAFSGVTSHGAEEVRQTLIELHKIWPHMQLPPSATNWNFNAWLEALPFWNELNEWELAFDDVITALQNSNADENKNWRSHPEINQALAAFQKIKEKYGIADSKLSLAHFVAGGALYYLRLLQILENPEFAAKLSLFDIECALDSIRRLYIQDFVQSPEYLHSESILSPHDDNILARLAVPLASRLYTAGYSKAKNTKEILDVAKNLVGYRSEWESAQRDSIKLNLKAIARNGDANFNWPKPLLEILARGGPIEQYNGHPLYLIHELIENIPESERTDATVLPMLASIIAYPRFLKEKADTNIRENPNINLFAAILGKKIAKSAFHTEEIERTDEHKNDPRFPTLWTAGQQIGPQKILRVVPTEKQIGEAVEYHQRYLRMVIQGRLDAGAPRTILGDLAETIREPKQRGWMEKLIDFCRRKFGRTLQ